MVAFASSSPWALCAVWLLLSVLASNACCNEPADRDGSSLTLDELSNELNGKAMKEIWDNNKRSKMVAELLARVADDEKSRPESVLGAVSVDELLSVNSSRTFEDDGKDYEFDLDPDQATDCTGERVNKREDICSRIAPNQSVLHKYCSHRNDALKDACGEQVAKVYLRVACRSLNKNEMAKVKGFSKQVQDAKRKIAEAAAKEREEKARIKAERELKRPGVARKRTPQPVDTLAEPDDEQVVEEVLSKAARFYKNSLNQSCRKFIETIKNSVYVFLNGHVRLGEFTIGGEQVREVEARMAKRCRLAMQYIDKETTKENSERKQ